MSPMGGRRVVEHALKPRAASVDLGGVAVDTWAFGDNVPGPLIRATAGDLLRITVENQLPADTSIHWHGIALSNAADGVPGLTQDPITPDSRFVYEFVAPDPGTYFYHPHVGVQLDRGLYAPLVIDDPAEPGDYDEEWIVVLDDWIDGTGKTPDDVLASLVAAPSGSSGPMGGMEGMDMGSGSSMSGMDGMPMESSESPFGDAGDVKYPHYLINGRVASSPDVLRARSGQRVRLRFINAAADTIFAVAVGGHSLSLTHADGFPVEPRQADAFYIGMGERYDAVVTLQDGVFPLVARPIGKDGRGFALIRTASGTAPAPDDAVAELNGPTLMGADLTPAESARLPAQDVEQDLALTLTGQMSPYEWAINGVAYPDNDPLTLQPGKRVQIQLSNMTMMAHPMHVHGHTFALPNGLRKDTVLLKPMQKLAVQLQADNPGNWMAHCHNVYHAEAGMMAALVYQS
ncbi:multicopper oxidase family protein [Nocardioides sp. NBC_00368]